MTTDRTAYIFGAGVSGLATGWKLLERGWNVEIIEREPFHGGMARTWKWNEFLIDVGPHLYHTPDPAVVEFWEREFGDLFVKGDFWCKNVLGENFDEYYEYPLSYEAISKYPSDLRKKVFQELEQINPEERAKASSYKQYVRALVGPTLQSMFFEEYPEKIWGLSTEEMTPLWAPKRVELRQKDTPFYHGQWNAVGKYGAGCICDRMYDKIVGLGGRVRLNQGVRGLGVDGTTIDQILLEGDERIEVKTRDVLISTIPISVLSRFLNVPCSLTFRGITSVYLAFDREFVIPEGIHWLYYGSPKVCFNRISEQKKLSPECAPPHAAHEMVQRAKREGVSMAVHHFMRYGGLAQSLARFAKEHELGEPLSIVVQGGAAGIVTTGIHWVDFAVELFGSEPINVVSTAYGEPINPRTPDVQLFGGSVIWTFEGGREAIVTYNNRSSISMTGCVFYRDATVEIDDELNVIARQRDMKAVEQFPSITRTGPVVTDLFRGQLPGMFSLADGMKTALSEIQNGKKMTVPGSAGVTAVSSCVGALLASRSERAVPLPIDPDTTEGRESWPMS